MLHDSQGFEPGEVNNFNKVKTFLDRRAQMPEIKDRLHAVWCVTHSVQENIAYVHLGCAYKFLMLGRLIEIGDEEFLKLPFDDRASSAIRRFGLVNIHGFLIPSPGRYRLHAVRPAL